MTHTCNCFSSHDLGHYGSSLHFKKNHGIVLFYFMKVVCKRTLHKSKGLLELEARDLKPSPFCTSCFTVTTLSISHNS